MSSLSLLQIPLSTKYGSLVLRSTELHHSFLTGTCFFLNREPSVREERCPDVDVIWKGPTQTQREGGSIPIDFTKFQWIENDDGTADYVGCKFIEFEYGVARDAAISPMLQSPQRAVCIWAALKNDDVPDNNA